MLTIAEFQLKGATVKMLITNQSYYTLNMNKHTSI